MKYLFFLAAFAIAVSAKAQKVNHFLQIGIAANAYKGDLQNSFDKFGSSFHLGLKFDKKKRLNGAFLLNIGKITGQSLNPIFVGVENTSIQPNRFFQSSIITGQYDLQLNLIKNQNWTVFLSQGAGLIRYDPKDDEGNKLIDMNNTRAPSEDYNNMSIMFPTQIGVLYKLKNDYALGIQAGYLNILTDYLDNISELGAKSGGDNIFIVRFSLLAPIIFKNSK